MNKIRQWWDGFSSTLKFIFVYMAILALIVFMALHGVESFGVNE